MADFIRARSDEQKEQRLAEIKRATSELFEGHPYHEITLTTIAERLGWSRANLYKYASTKEEIFLLLAQDQMDSYFDALMAVFPQGCGLDAPVIAEVWAGIANAHHLYFRIGDILLTIIETNVTIDRLIAFKGDYYKRHDALAARLADLLHEDEARSAWTIEAVYTHAVGLVSSCANNPLVTQALEALGIERRNVDFRSEMRDFILMCLERR